MDETVATNPVPGVLPGALTLSYESELILNAEDLCRPDCESAQSVGRLQSVVDHASGVDQQI